MDFKLHVWEKSYLFEIKLPMFGSIIYCQNVLLDHLLMYVVKIVFHFFLLSPFQAWLYLFRLLFKCSFLPNILESVFEKSQSVIGGKFFSFFRAVFELSKGSSIFQKKWSILLVWGTCPGISIDKVFASVLCVFLLSSVSGRFIQLCHPNNGMYKLIKMFI